MLDAAPECSSISQLDEVSVEGFLLAVYPDVPAALLQPADPGVASPRKQKRPCFQGLFSWS